MTFQDIAQIKQANRDAGKYFFEPGTMRFFHSRVLPKVYGGRFFITSECREPHPYRDMGGTLQPATPRYYTVREARDDGSIETVGEFNQLTKADAVQLAKDVAHFGAEKYFAINKASAAAS